MSDRASDAVDSPISMWSESGGHERGGGQQFLLEFCDLVGLDKPDPPSR